MERLRVLDLDPGPRVDTSLGHPAVRDPVGAHAREHHDGVDRRGPDRQGRRRIRLPGASTPYPGITLSDEETEGERARSRRYVPGEIAIN